MMINRKTKSMCFDLYLDAAKKFGIKVDKVTSVKDTLGRFSFRGKSLLISGNIINLNGVLSAKITPNKYLTSMILRENDFPVPKSIIIDSEFDLSSLDEKLSNSIKSPWVVKPLEGSSGKGITVDIKDSVELHDAVNYAREYHEKVLIEEFIEGKHFRIVVYDDKVLDVIERIPAYVTGDGKSRIKELIDQKNQRRKEIGMSVIQVDDNGEIESDQGDLSMRSIPDKGALIPLKKISNMGGGGETERISIDNIHQDNLPMFIDCLKPFDLGFCGVDFITPDITQSYKDVTCGINELNSYPMLDVNYFADFEFNNFVTESVFREYFDI